MREDLRVRAQDDINVTQIAVDANPFRSGNEEVLRGSTLLLRSVLRVRRDVNDLFGPAELVDFMLLFDEVLTDGTDHLREVLPCRDHAPPAYRVEADGNRAFRK